MNNINSYSKYLDGKHKKIDVVTTGYSNIDGYMAYGGMQRQFCLVIPGKSGIGKTYFVLCPMLKMAEEGKRVLFFSLEMAYDVIMDRFHQVILEVHLSELREYIQKNEKEVIKKLNEIKFLDNLLILDGVYDIAMMEKIIQTEKPDVIFIDHLHLIRTKYIDIFKKTTYLMEEITRLKKQYNTRFVVLVQIKRSDDFNETNSKIPSLEAGKGSGAVEELCDMALCVARPDVDPHCEHGRKNLIVGLIRKNRFPSPELMSELQWRYDRTTGRLTEII